MSRPRSWTRRGPVASFMPTPHHPIEHDVELWDGTLEHIGGMSRMAASRSHLSGPTHGDKQDAALLGITMRLAEDPDTPVWELIGVGVDSISRTHQTRLQQTGARTDGAGTGSRFAAFWRVQDEPAADRRLDTITARQVWAGLGQRHQETLLGMIAHPSTAEHAEKLGLSMAGVRKRIRQSRQAALNLWFDWETAPKPTPDVRRTTHCARGHNLDEHGSWMNRTGRGRTRYCLTCANQRNQKSRIT